MHQNQQPLYWILLKNFGHTCCSHTMSRTLYTKWLEIIREIKNPGGLTSILRTKQNKKNPVLWRHRKEILVVRLPSPMNAPLNVLKCFFLFTMPLFWKCWQLKSRKCTYIGPSMAPTMALLEDILKKFRVEYDIDIVHHGIERNLKIMYLFWQPRLNKFAKIISESCKTGPLKWLKMSSKIKRFWLVQLTCPCRPSSYHTMPWIDNMKQQNTLMKKTFLIYSRGSQGCLKGSNQFQGHRRAQGKKKN